MAVSIAVHGARRFTVSMAGSLSFVDSHCHLQSPRFCGQQADLLKDISSWGVKWLVVNGTSEDDWDSVRELAKANHQVIPSFGLHPWYVNNRSSDWANRLRALLEDVPNAAIGEIGLDKSTRGKSVDMETQVDVFKQQLQIAKEFRRPVAVHCVKAFGPLDQLVREIGPFPCGIILHSYGGPAEMVKSFAEQGAYFSFSGLITSISQSKAKSVLQSIPSDRLLLETDCPDAFPKVDEGRALEACKDCEGPAEGGKPINHPANIHVVAEVVASLLDVPLEDVCRRAYENAVSVFSYSGSQIACLFWKDF